MAVYVISDGIAKAMPFLVFPIVAYYLTREEFGLVNNYQVLLGIIAPFVGLSASSYFAVDYYRKSINNKALYNNIIYFNFILLTIVTIIISLMSRVITDLTALTIKWIYLALLSSAFMIFIDLFLTRLRMEERARFFGTYNVLKSALSALLTVLFLVGLKMTWEGRIYSIFLTTVVAGSVAILFTKRFIVKLHRPDFKQMKSLLLFGLPLLPHNLSIWIRAGFDKLFITNSLGLAENGMYSFAVTISTVFTMFSGAFFAAFSPYAYKALAQNESEGLEKRDRAKLGIVKKSYIFLAGYFFLLVAGYFASLIFVHFFFKEKYGESLEYLPFLLAFNFFNAAYIFVSMMVYYSKSTKYLGLITIFASFIQAFLVMVLVNQIGAKGAAISAMVVSILTLIAVYFYSHKVYPMPWLSFFKKMSFTGKKT